MLTGRKVEAYLWVSQEDKRGGTQYLTPSGLDSCLLVGDYQRRNNSICPGCHKAITVALLRLYAQKQPLSPREIYFTCLCIKARFPRGKVLGESYK